MLPRILPMLDSIPKLARQSPRASLHGEESPGSIERDAG